MTLRRAQKIADLVFTVVLTAALVCFVLGAWL